MELLLIVLAVIGFLFFKFSGTAKPKTYPILTPDMFQPADLKITTAEAKRLFKQYIGQICYLEKDEITEHAGYLADEIHGQEEALREDVASAKESIKSSTGRINTLKKTLAKCTDETRKEEILEEIEAEEFEIESATQDLAETQQALDAFKQDKREFLIGYINDQVHGPGWRDIK